MLRILEENIMYQSFKGGLGGIALSKHGRSRACLLYTSAAIKFLQYMADEGGMEASYKAFDRYPARCV